MAKQSGTRKSSSTRKTGSAKADVPGRLVAAALTLAAERGWRDLSLADIADAAGVSLSEAHGAYPSKRAILNAFSRGIDAEILGAEEPEAREGGARDRLFDVVMRRFDALRPHRKAVGNILWDQACDPLAAFCGLAPFERSMACMLESAGLASDGVRGLLRTKALGFAYLATLRVWLRDDSPDMAATMAALDRNLGRLDQVARCCSRLQRTRPATVDNPA